MPYSVRQYDNGTVELRRNGAVELTVDASINPRLAGHLCTPKFHDVQGTAQQGPGFVQYVNCLSDAGGKWVIDTVTRRLQCAEAAIDETAKNEDERDEVLGLRQQFAQELADGLGIPLARARFFLGFLWRFLKVEGQLRGR